MKRIILIAFSLAFHISQTSARTQTPQPAPQTNDRTAPIKNVLGAYCVGCNSAMGKAGGHAFAGIAAMLLAATS